MGWVREAGEGEAGTSQGLDTVTRRTGRPLALVGRAQLAIHICSMELRSGALGCGLYPEGLVW